MTVADALEDFPLNPQTSPRTYSRQSPATSSKTSRTEGESEPGKGFKAFPWPAPWSRNQKDPKRLLGWASGGKAHFEDGRTASYSSQSELNSVLFFYDAYLLMPAKEFNKWVPSYIKSGQCVYAEAANRIIGFRVKMGSRVRYCYNAESAWPGIEKAGFAGLDKLRAFFDAAGVGDLSTPGALGLRLAERLIPRNERFWHPGWCAWLDLHDHAVAGWVDLFATYQGEHAVMLDMNSAYPAAARQGMPAGVCTRIFTESDAAEEAWTFGRYEWRLSSDAGVVERERYTVLAITNRGKAHATGEWTPEPGTAGQGWYTGVEVQAARDSGAFTEFELTGGWGWSRVSSAFAEWVACLDAAKGAYQALGEDGALELDWLKRMMVAPFGRFFMDAFECEVTEPGDKPAEGAVYYQQYGGQDVVFQVSKSPPKRWNPTLLPQLSAHVWSYTRIELARTMQLAHEAGWEIFMCAVDGAYMKPRGRAPALPLDYGRRAGQWKQKDLFGANIPAAGWASGTLDDGTQYRKTPGLKHP